MPFSVSGVALHEKNFADLYDIKFCCFLLLLFIFCACLFIYFFIFCFPCYTHETTYNVQHFQISFSDTARGMLSFAKELNSLGSDPQPVSAWAMGQNEIWPKIKDNLKTISTEFSTLSEQYAQQVSVNGRGSNRLAVIGQFINC